MPPSATCTTGATAAAGTLQPLFAQITEAADILVLCGDLTDYGLADEARALAREITSTLKIPVVAVLGNHDFESGQQDEIRKILNDAGVVTLDGDTTEIHGIGFAGMKGFAGGFGRRALGPWGEDIIKKFVHEAVHEALKLESALARLRNDRLIAGAPLLPDPGDRRGGAARDLSVPRLQPARRAAHALPRDRRLPRPRAPRAARRAHAHRTCPCTTSRMSLMRELFPERPFRLIDVDMTGFRRRPRIDGVAPIAVRSSGSCCTPIVTMTLLPILIVSGLLAQILPRNRQAVARNLADEALSVARRRANDFEARVGRTHC